MLKLRFRKKEELTKEFWVKTVEWITTGIGLVFVLVLLGTCVVVFIPSIYNTNPDIPKLSYGLLFCGGVFTGISFILRKIWHIKSK